MWRAWNQGLIQGGHGPQMSRTPTCGINCLSEVFSPEPKTAPGHTWALRRNQSWQRRQRRLPEVAQCSTPYRAKIYIASSPQLPVDRHLTNHFVSSSHLHLRLVRQQLRPELSASLVGNISRSIIGKHVCSRHIPILYSLYRPQGSSPCLWDFAREKFGDRTLYSF